MDVEDRQLGEAVLRHLLLGAQIEEIRSGPIPKLLLKGFLTPNPPEIRVRAQTYLNIESRWKVFSTRPAVFPDQVTDIPSQDEHAQFRVLASLHGKTIQSVDLGEQYPHLLLTLDDGQSFFLCGNNDQYESWQCGANYGDPDDYWLVVATPGGGLAIWAPQGFP